MDGLWARLEREAKLDVRAEAASFARETGGDDPDLFLSWLHGKKRISDALFAELAGGGQIAVARFVGVKEKTLLLEPPKKTMILPSNLPTVVAEGSQPGAIEPAPEPRDSSRGRYSLLGCLGKGAMGEVHVARDE